MRHAPSSRNHRNHRGRCARRDRQGLRGVRVLQGKRQHPDVSGQSHPGSQPQLALPEGREGEQLRHRRVRSIQHRDRQHCEVPRGAYARSHSGPTGTGAEDPGRNAKPHAGRRDIAEKHWEHPARRRDGQRRPSDPNWRFCFPFLGDERIQSP